MFPRHFWNHLIRPTSGFYFLLSICCFISERPPCSVENTAMHTVQNPLTISSYILKAVNSDCKCTVNAHLLIGISKKKNNFTTNKNLKKKKGVRRSGAIPLMYRIAVRRSQTSSCTLPHEIRRFFIKKKKYKLFFLHH